MKIRNGFVSNSSSSSFILSVPAEMSETPKVTVEMELEIELENLWESMGDYGAKIITSEEELDALIVRSQKLKLMKAWACHEKMDIFKYAGPSDIEAMRAALRKGRHVVFGDFRYDGNGPSEVEASIAMAGFPQFCRQNNFTRIDTYEDS